MGLWVGEGQGESKARLVDGRHVSSAGFLGGDVASLGASRCRPRLAGLQGKVHAMQLC